MRTFTPFFILFLIFVSLNSCVEEVELPNTRQGGQLVINGILTPTQAPHQLSISRTSADVRITEPVLGASVEISDELGNKELYREKGEGQYELLGDNVIGRIGGTYKLRIEIFGQVYESIPETMPGMVGYDSVSWETTPQKFIQIYADSYLPKSENPLYIRWNVEEVYRFDPTDFPDPFNSIPPPCFVWEYPNKQTVILHDGELSPTEFLPRVKVAQQYVDFRFLARHYFLVQQLSISREAFEYWDKINKAVNRTGSIFDPPPAPVPGNLFNVNNPEEQVLGYFEVALTDTATIFTVPGYFNFWIPPYCEYVPFKPFGQYPRPCLDCLFLPNSSFMKPDFFI